MKIFRPQPGPERAAAFGQDRSINMSAHEIVLKEEVFEALKQHCRAVCAACRQMSVDELLVELMDNPDVPIHYPYHHFIMPAALLTLAAAEQHLPEEELGEMLDTAEERAKNVLGGFCGNYGACGAGVGAGIFLSVYTDTSPMSETSWQWVNELTGLCLQKLASVPGPRCCKRTSFLSIQESVPYINEKLGLHLTVSDGITCHYYERNQECKKEECPFYPPLQS